MFNENEKITTVEQAKEYYVFMGCSHFNMSREYPDRYEEYKALGISKKTEKNWTAEQAKKELKILKKSTGEKAYWSLSGYLEKTTFTKRNVKKLYRLIREKYETFEPTLMVVLVETLCGYHTNLGDYCLETVLKCSKIWQNRYFELFKEMCGCAVLRDSSLSQRVDDIFSLKRKQEKEKLLKELSDELDEIIKKLS